MKYTTHQLSIEQGEHICKALEDAQIAESLGFYSLGLGGRIGLRDKAYFVETEKGNGVVVLANSDSKVSAIVYGNPTIEEIIYKKLKYIIENSN